MNNNIEVCLECCVCLERMTNPCTWMPCQHMACMTCVSQSGSQCPVCRQEATHICLPAHNRTVWQMCGQDRGATALRDFMSMYDTLARFQRWMKRDTQKIPAIRFFLVHRMSEPIAQQINTLKTLHLDHETKYKNAQRVARREKAMVDQYRQQMNEILTQYCGVKTVL